MSKEIAETLKYAIVLVVASSFGYILTNYILPSPKCDETGKALLDIIIGFWGMVFIIGSIDKIWFRSKMKI